MGFADRRWPTCLPDPGAAVRLGPDECPQSIARGAAAVPSSHQRPRVDGPGGVGLPGHVYPDAALRASADEVGHLVGAGASSRRRPGQPWIESRPVGSNGEHSVSRWVHPSKPPRAAVLRRTLLRRGRRAAGASAAAGIRTRTRGRTRRHDVGGRFGNQPHLVRGSLLGLRPRSSQRRAGRREDVCPPSRRRFDGLARGSCRVALRVVRDASSRSANGSSRGARERFLDEEVVAGHNLRRPHRRRPPLLDRSRGDDERSRQDATES